MANELAIIKTALSIKGKTFREQLDAVDEQISNAVYGGYYISRLGIIIGQWEKGRIVWEFTRGKIQRSTAKETGRDWKSLKSWYKLYEKHFDRADFVENYAKPKAELWTQRVLEQSKKLALPKDTPPLPPGKFDVIYADPPWQYDNTGFETSAEQHYDTMTTADICSLDVPSKTVANGVLFLWATNPFLAEALDVVEAWGFDYKTNLCWIKEGSAIAGFYVRGAHELLFVATRGKMLPTGELPISTIKAAKGRHSEKPDIVYDLIEQMYPEGKYLELFARNRHSEKWTVWGLEA